MSGRERPFQEKVPGWLAALGIQPGEYFVGSKLKLKRGMKTRCFSEAARIWCCLGLHTDCFQQELAVKLVGNKRLPLQPIDVATETGIKKQNIRRGMLELRAWGLGEIEGDEHHMVRLYGWVKPRPVIPEEVIARDYLVDVPGQFRSLFRRFKVRPAEGFEFTRDYLAEIETAARDYAKSVEVLKSVLGRSRAGDPIQRNERNSERNDFSSSAVCSPVAEIGSAQKAEEDGYEAFKRLYPENHFDEGKAKPAFRKLVKSERGSCIERLHVYLKCERWLADGGRWIPLASNWLKSYTADPPPHVAVSKKAAQGGDDPLLQQLNEDMKWQTKR